MWIRVGPCLLTILLFFSSSSPTCAQPPAADELLAGAAATQELLSRSISVVDVDFGESDARGGKVHGHNRLHRYQDSDGRIRVDLEVRESEKSAGMPLSKSTVKKEFIFLGDRHALHVPGQTVVYTDSPAKLATWAQILRFDATFGGFMDGWVPVGSTSGDNVVRLARAGRSRVRPDPEVVDGVTCYRVDADTSVGSVRLWIAPSQGYNLARIEVDGGKSADLESFVIRVDRFKFTSVNGKSFPTSAHYEGRFVPVGGAPAYSNDADANRSRLELNPKFDPSVFSLSHIPDGTRAILEDDQRAGVKYVWRGGRPVPSADMMKVAQIRRDAAPPMGQGNTVDPGFGGSGGVWRASGRPLIILAAGVAALVAWLAVTRWVLPRWARRGEH